MGCDCQRRDVFVCPSCREISADCEYCPECGDGPLCVVCIDNGVCCAAAAEASDDDVIYG